MVHLRVSVNVGEVLMGKNVINVGLVSLDFPIARNATVTCLG